MTTQEFTSRAKAREFAKNIEGATISKTAPWIVTIPVDLSQKIEDVRQLIAAIKTADDVVNAYDVLNAAELGEPITTELDEEIGYHAQRIEADAALNQADIEGAAPLKNGKPWIKASTTDKPTKKVWAIADEMVAAAEAQGLARPSRSQVQDECVRRGIASGTARTQYQHWFKTMNESAQAPRSTVVDGKIIPATKA